MLFTHAVAQHVVKNLLWGVAAVDAVGCCGMVYAAASCAVIALPLWHLAWIPADAVGCFV